MAASDAEAQPFIDDSMHEQSEKDEPTPPSVSPWRRGRLAAVVLFGVAAASLALFALVVVRHEGRLSVQSVRSFARLYVDTQHRCPVVTTAEPFDLATFQAKPWYIQTQMPVLYQPADRLICVKATYSPTDSQFWGYTTQVRNFAGKNGNCRDTKNFLCAAPGDPNVASKLQVGPCFLPRIPGLFTGAYWVVAYDEIEGYALVSGGQPTWRRMSGGISNDDMGGCRTGDGINDAGLWIFTRQQVRNDYLVNKVRGIAQAKGFDLSVLHDVDQTGCDCPGY